MHRRKWRLTTDLTSIPELSSFAHCFSFKKDSKLPKNEKTKGIGASFTNHDSQSPFRTGVPSNNH
jgi:hypothetical protein